MDRTKTKNRKLYFVFEENQIIFSGLNKNREKEYRIIMSSNWSLAFQTRGYSVTNSRLYNTSPNTNTGLNKVCTSCNADKTITYTPLKTTRYHANLSQKMKQAVFLRRAQENTISKYDTIQFDYRNL